MTNQVGAWEKVVTEQGLQLAELKTDMVYIKDLLL